MSKTRIKKAPRGQSPAMVFGTWASGLLSLGFVYFCIRAVMSDLGGFRSCANSNSGLSVESCGKSSLNLGDIMLLGLLILAIFLCLSLLTAAWRMSRRPSA